MKDIYTNMGSQDILKFGGLKLDLRIDYSENYDYELDFVKDFEEFDPNNIERFNNPVVDLNFTSCEYCLLTSEGLIIQTVDYKQLQYQP